MRLTRLALTNFRNYPHLEVDLKPGLTLLQGNNAQGKTNLLEAIFYLATARSPHARAERELIRWGASTEPIPFARILGEVSRRNGQAIGLEIVLLQPADEKGAPSLRVNKRIKVNGVNKRALDLYGQLNVVLFLPEDLDMVFGAPGERRKYLDTTLAQVDPRYGRALAKYNQVVEQRNSLLRDARERGFRLQPGELEVWNASLVEEGSYIVARRAETVARYNRLIAEIHPRLSAHNEELRLAYQPSVTLEGETPAVEAVRARFESQLATQRARESAAGLTLVGPHRDDLRFFADGVDMITYASRGQGRTIALSLKLAEVELMRAETGEDPVLLLDDVMSELDRPRRAALSQSVLNASQALISATDLDDFSDALRAQATIYSVTGSRLDLAFTPAVSTPAVPPSDSGFAPEAGAAATPADLPFPASESLPDFAPEALAEPFGESEPEGEQPPRDNAVPAPEPPPEATMFDTNDGAEPTSDLAGDTPPEAAPDWPSDAG